MKNKGLFDELNNIDREIGEIETELRVIEHCAGNGLDYDKAENYARAFITIHRRTSARQGYSSNKSPAMLHHSNHLEAGGQLCYNRDIREHLESCRKRIVDISLFSERERNAQWETGSLCG